MNFKIFSCVFILASCLSLLTHAQTDGTQYPITDPRNPNCPCHKHQQKADEEYRQLQQSSRQQLNVQQLFEQNKITEQPLPDLDENKNILVSFPRLVTPLISMPEVDIPLALLMPSLKANSGIEYKYRSHSFKKIKFKISKKKKKMFQRKKKIRTKIDRCFGW